MFFGSAMFVAICIKTEVIHAMYPNIIFNESVKLAIFVFAFLAERYMGEAGTKPSLINDHRGS